MSFHQKIFEENTRRALNLIWFLLRKSLESKPLPNKLHTRVLVFRYERKFEFNIPKLNDVSLIDYFAAINQHLNCTSIMLQYCFNLPFVYVIPKPDYKSMLEDKKMIEVITKNVVLSYPIGIELSLSDKYKNFYFNIEKYLSIHKS